MKVLLVILSILVIGISSLDEKPNTTRDDLPPQDKPCNGTEVEDCCEIAGCWFHSCKNFSGFCLPIETKSKCPEGSEDIIKCQYNTSSSKYSGANNDTTVSIPVTTAAINTTIVPVESTTTAAINTTIITVEPSTDRTEGPNTTVVTTPSTNETTTTSGSNSTSTTSVSNSTASPTQTPNTSTSAGAPSTTAPSQRFDPASFIGGIVLCGAIVSIVFFGIKFYKARTGQNYHTL